MKDRPAFRDALTQLVGAMGHAIAWRTLREAMDVTGIRWEPARKTAGGRTGRITQKAADELRRRLTDAEHHVGILIANVAQLSMSTTDGKLGESRPHH